jgi:hypothetical protein
MSENDEQYLRVVCAALRAAEAAGLGPVLSEFVDHLLTYDGTDEEIIARFVEQANE